MIFHRYADQVLVGNEVLIPQNNELIPTEVKNIAYSKIQGNHSF